MLKLLSWNVNGIRSVMQKGFSEFVEKEKPDILCLQETKAHVDQVDLWLKDYKHYWNSAQKKGYSGTAVFTKIQPINVTYGMGIPEHDEEGRIITLEFDDFYVVNVYTVNAQRGLTRLVYRQRGDSDFLHYVKTLEKKKPVIFCGDLNVAHKEIDLARPKDNRRNAGFTDEERADFDRYINEGFIDTFREFHKEPNQYTWWSYMSNARERNIGWRIDYVMISNALLPRLKAAFIKTEIRGSDHAPVGILLE